jgi:chromosomal replication initiation ATPase DnaA
MQYSNDDVWSIVKNNLISKNTENRLLQTWFLPTDLVSIENNNSAKRFRLGVPTELHKYWISENLFDRICSEISSVCKQPFEVELVVTGKAMNTDLESPGALHQVMSSTDRMNERHDDMLPMTVNDSCAN